MAEDTFSSCIWNATKNLVLPKSYVLKTRPKCPTALSRVLDFAVVELPDGIRARHPLAAGTPRRILSHPKSIPGLVRARDLGINYREESLL